MASTEIDLTIKGELATLRLQPDDKVVVSLKRHVTRMVANEIMAQVKAIFPDNQVLMMAEGVEIKVARFDDRDPGDETDYSRVE